MKTILAISLVSLSFFSSAASACGMPPARGMGLAQAMEKVEAAPAVVEEVEAEVVQAEPVEPEANAPALAEVEEPAVLIAVPQAAPDADADADAPADPPAAQATKPNS